MMHLLLASALLITTTVASRQPDVEAFARAMIPLLKDVRASVDPKLYVEPATLPPSPFTGRNSTLVAFRIGRRAVHAPPSVVEVIDRWLRWNQREALSAADIAVVERWREALRVKLLGRLAATGATGVGCTDDCLLDHFTKPGKLFGRSRREQVDTRNEMLLDALIQAVEEQPST